jgi:hypothetical protein
VTTGSKGAGEKYQAKALRELSDHADSKMSELLRMLDDRCQVTSTYEEPGIAEQIHRSMHSMRP